MTALSLLKQIKRFDGNMSREQNQRYYELETLLKEHAKGMMFYKNGIVKNHGIQTLFKDSQGFVFVHLNNEWHMVDYRVDSWCIIYGMSE